MGKPSHKIKREVFEIEAHELELARRLSADTARIHAPRIVPILENVCGEVSSTDRLHRIDRVEVDLGPIPANDFENELCERLEKHLRRALREKIRAYGRKYGAEATRIASLLDLLACFARTGNLPWWADTTRAGLLEESARALLHEAPSELAELVRELVREPAPLRRIPVAFHDAVLAELCLLLRPGRAGRAMVALPPALVQLLQAGKLDVPISAVRCHDIAWQCVLLLAARSRQAPDAETERTFALAVCEEALAEIAVAVRITYGALLAVLREQHNLAAVRALLAQVPLLERWERGIVERRSGVERAQPAKDAGHGAERAQPAKDAGESVIAWDELIEQCRSMATRAPPGRAARWRTLQGVLEPALETTGQTTAESSADRVTDVFQGWAGVYHLLAQALSDGRLSAELLQRCLSDLAEVSEAPASRALRASLARVLRDVIAAGRTEASPPPETRGGEERFSDSDELYIQDAGLVLLWPFLRAFFQNLALLDGEDRWKTRQAQHRAVAIAHGLSTGEPIVVEYQLSLAKILCGLDPTQMVEPSEPLSDAEIQECEELLSAAITAAPILNDMSIPAFRTTFLARRGMLAHRDGAWLLRVEPETYDVVLDRLPWTFAWAALPWMAAPLRVEWR